LKFKSNIWKDVNFIVLEIKTNSSKAIANHHDKNICFLNFVQRDKTFAVVIAIVY